MTSDVWLSAPEAARRLEVTRATLYAYVSRGYIRSEATQGSTRARRYSREDVERLRRRADERRDPGAVATHAIHWGLPVLESAITLVADGHLHYRGHDAVTLAHTRTVAEVASLIWTGTFEGLVVAPPVVPRFRRSRTPNARLPADFIARAQIALADASLHDDSAFDLGPSAVAATGRRIMHVLARAAAPAASSDGPIDETLARAWKVKRAGVPILRAALILCADHELNVSAFTARCVASAEANPYAVVTAALSALQGTRHGGSTLRVESTMASLRRAPKLRAALGERLRAGERLHGFGHPLYPGGDPRATALLDMLNDGYRRSAELAYVRRLAAAGAALSSMQPNLDFALGAVARVLALPRGAGLALFAIGRTMGWLGHAIEQYAAGQLIRPRAKYVGPPIVAAR